MKDIEKSRHLKGTGNNAFKLSDHVVPRWVSMGDEINISGAPLNRNVTLLDQRPEKRSANGTNARDIGYFHENLSC